MLLTASVPFFLGSTVPGQAATPERAIKVVMDDNYPPYVFKDAAGNLQGVTVDQWRLWENSTGRKVEIHAMDWGEALRRMRAGEFDVIDTIFQTDERATFLDFTPPYARLEVPIFFREDISGITGLESLRGFPVAAKAGDNAADQLSAKGIAPLLLFNSYEAIIAAAKEHKVNVFVVDKPPATYLLNKEGIADQFRMSAPIGVGEFHRAVQKGNSALLREITRGFAALPESDLRAIDEKWFGQVIGDPRWRRRFGYVVLFLAVLAILVASWILILRRTVREKTRELRESEERWKFALEGTGDGVWDLQVPTREVHFSKGWKEMLGYGENEIPDRFEAWEKLVHPEDLPGALVDFERFLASREANYISEHRLRRKDGSYRWILVRGTAVSRDKTGKPVRMVGTHSDITGRREAHAILERARAELERAQRISHVGSWEYNVRDDSITWSDELYRIFGLEPQSVILTYDRLFAMVHPNDREAHNAYHDRLAAVRPGNKVEPFEYRVPRPDGRIAHVQVDAEVQFDDNGKAFRWFGTVQDITERKEAEAALLESRERFEALAHNSMQGISLVQDERIVYVNPAFSAISGYSPEETIQMSLTEVYGRIHPDDRGKLLERRRRFEAGEIVEGEDEIRIRHKNGAWRWIRSSTKGFMLRGRAARLSMMADITSQKRAEIALREREEQLRLFVDHSPAAVAMLNRDMKYLVVSRRWMEDYRLGNQSIVGRSHYEIFPEIPGRWREIHRRCLQGAIETCDEDPFLRSDGRTDWIRWEVRPWHQTDRTIGGIIIFSENITIRKQAEAALRESEERFRNAFEEGPVGIAMAGFADGRFIQVNRALCEMLGYTKEELKARTFAEITHPDHRAVDSDAVRQLAAGHIQGHHVEKRYLRKDGTVIWATRTLTKIQSADGKSSYALAMIEDITERRRAEEALRASERKLRRVIDGLGPSNFVGLLSVDGVVLEANRPALDAAGLRLEDVLGKPVDQTHWFAYSKEVQAQIRASIKRAAAGEPSRYDLQIQVAGGSLVWLDFSINPVLDEAGRVIHLVPSGTVIDERKSTEEKLRKSETDYRTLLESASDAIWVSDQQGRVLDVNAASSRMFGYTRAELLAMNIVDVIAKEEVSQVGRRIGRLKEGENARGEWLCRRKDGTHFPVEVSATILPDGRLMGILRDGTERKVAQEALRHSEAQLSTALKIAHLGHWEYDVATDRFTFNDHFYALMRTTAEREGGYTMRSHDYARRFCHPDDMGVVDIETARAISATDPHYTSRLEHRVRFGDGTSGHVAVTVFVVKDAAGRTVGTYGVNQDITASKLLEEQYRQSQKLEAIGQLAGGVAHDFNNILAAIMMQADLASSTDGLPREADEMLGEIKAAAERAANLTRQLLAFSRRQVMQPRPVDLNDVVTSLAKMLQRILGEDVSLQLNLHSKPLMTRADAGMLDQVLLNLVVNARDAMPGGGKLSIVTRELNISDQEASLIPEASPGRHVSLSVTDTGAGIAPEYVQRIFEPFFTTKAPGKGTGLGLATVFGIVKQHGGWLKLESEVGRGTTFHIALPAIDPADEPTDKKTPKSQPRGGTETVLLVEDEPAVRMLTRIMLEKHGYTVLEAGDGPAALKTWDEAGGAIDLLFTDLVMPEGVSGSELAAELQALKPGIKVIFTSGYSADIAGRELELKAGENFIQKPCPPETLLEVVRRSLDS